MSARIVVFLVVSVVLVAVLVTSPTSAHKHTEREALITLTNNVIPLLVKIKKLEKRLDEYPNDVAASNSPEWRKLIAIEEKLIELLQISCYYDLKFGFEKNKMCMRLCQEPYPLSKKQYASDLNICELQILGALSGCY